MWFSSVSVGCVVRWFSSVSVGCVVRWFSSVSVGCVVFKCECVVVWLGGFQV